MAKDTKVTGVMGVQEVLQCPECNGKSISVPARLVGYRDQQRCACLECRYAGRWWRFRRFVDVLFEVHAE